jgi:hypothetical protein
MWFSILQRKLLEPNDFASTEASEQAISDYISYYNHHHNATRAARCTPGVRLT